jgi:hypothetical protein
MKEVRTLKIAPFLRKYTDIHTQIKHLIKF